MTSGAPLANLTVAVATMDRPVELGRCFSALLEGEVLPREVVVVDQSATDATREVVARLGAGVPRVAVSYVKQARRGVSASRNAAIDRATQPIIAFTDDDCVPDRGWVATLDRAFADGGRPDGVTGRVLPLGPEVPHLFAVSTRASTVRAEYARRALPWLVGSGGNTAVRREAIRRAGGFDERLGPGSPGRGAEDLDVLHRLLRSGARIRYEPDAVVYHERQTGARRLASRPQYGFGLGAFCAVHLRHRDAYAAWILARWSVDRLRMLARAVARLRWPRAHEEVLMLGGAVRGMLHGLRVEGEAAGDGSGSPAAVETPERSRP